MEPHTEGGFYHHGNPPPPPKLPVSREREKKKKDWMFFPGSDSGQKREKFCCGNPKKICDFCKQVPFTNRPGFPAPPRRLSGFSSLAGYYHSSLQPVTT